MTPDTQALQALSVMGPAALLTFARGKSQIVDMHGCLCHCGQSHESDKSIPPRCPVDALGDLPHPCTRVLSYERSNLVGTATVVAGRLFDALLESTK